MYLIELVLFIAYIKHVNNARLIKGGSQLSLARHHAYLYTRMPANQVSPPPKPFNRFSLLPH